MFSLNMQRKTKLCTRESTSGILGLKKKANLIIYLSLEHALKFLFSF